MTAGEAHQAFLGFPLVDLDALLGRGSGGVLVLAPHPDDESLGTGGLIALASRAGRPCHVAIVTDGARSHPGSRLWPPARLAALRRDEARDALRRLGHPPDRTRFLDLPDASVPLSGPLFDRTVDRVASLARDGDCGTLVASWISDPHGDHVGVSGIARAAARRVGARLLSYPVWGWTLAADATVRDETPWRGARLDIADVLDRKCHAIGAHRSQHGLVIDDAPDGFVLPARLLDPCTRPFEVYVETAA